jgi:hypothetical protein
MGEKRYFASTSLIAEIIGKTEQRVNQLAKEGVLKKISSGKWDLAENMKMYIAFLENGRGGKDAAALEMQKLEADVDYKRAKADMTELELQELRGNMHRSEDVGGMTDDLILTIKALLLALPGQLAVDMAGVANPGEASELLSDAAAEILKELSQYRYDAEKYRTKARERYGLSEADDDDGQQDSETK